MPDLAFHIFQIVSKQDLAIQNQRYGAVLTQIFPFLGVQFGFSLDTISKLFSLSYPILYFIVYLILIILKCEKFIVLLFIYLFMMATHSFFWPISEIHQGCVLLIVYVALLDNYQYDFKKWSLILCTILLLPTIIFLYPLMIILIMFVLGYLYKIKELYKTVYIIFIFSSICMFVKVFVYNSSYDNSGMARVLNINNYLQFFNLHSTKQFIGQCFANFYIWLFSLAIISWLLYKRQKAFQLFLLIGFSLGLIVLINVGYPNGGDTFYLEGQFMQLSFFLGFIFVQEFWMDIRNSLKISILFLVFGFFLLRFDDAVVQYSGRLNFYRNLMISHIDKKMLIAENEKHINVLKMTWCSSFETWLLSTIEFGKSASILISKNPAKFQMDLNKKNAWMTEWETIEYSHLHPQYFIFNDTTTNYNLVQTD